MKPENEQPAGQKKRYLWMQGAIDWVGSALVGVIIDRVVTFWLG
ncbi:hypothetical protein ACFV0D_37675 [Streptomyces sp. NPDC059556]